MLLENAQVLSGVRNRLGKFYYVSGSGRPVTPYVKELGKTVLDYRQYLVYANFIGGNYVYSKMHDNMFGYMNSVKSANGEFNSSEYNALKLYFKPSISQAMITLNSVDCMLIYPDTSNGDLWFIWNPKENLLDFVEYAEDEFGMPDVRTSVAYEDRYGELNCQLLKSLRDFVTL